MTNPRRRRSSVGMSFGGSSSSHNHRSTGKSADAVVAATAGEDSWKTWAGRSHGDASFEFMDLIRGAKRTIQHSFMAGTTPPAGTTCPVCFCEPEQADEWHITSSCCHAVCKDCLQGYATSQVQDPMHTGPLKCPVCPQVLRRKDALVALGGNVSLIQQWDEKIKNQLLRALPSYRPCPKCSLGTANGGSGASSTEESASRTKSGGGFVTPACLAPQFQERREKASRIIHGIWMVPLGLAVLYCSFVSYIGRHPSQSALVDLFFMVSSIHYVIKCLRSSQVWIAQLARTAFFRPITVECPCCDESFLLPAQTKEIADEESKNWIGAHTRPCPSCSVPISKTGGCNHMNCPNCRASFCWACMQLRTDCRAFRCTRGAQYGNAIPGAPGEDRAPRLLGGSILDTIDYVLDERRGRNPVWHHYDGLFAFSALFLRRTWMLQTSVAWIMNFVAGIFANGILSLVVLGISCWKVFQFVDDRRKRLQRGRRHMQDAIQLAGLDPADAAAIVDVLQENVNNWNGQGNPRPHSPQGQQRNRRRRSSLTSPRRAAPQAPLHSPRNTTRRRRRHSTSAPSQTASEFLLGADDRNRRDRERNLRHLSERDMLREAIQRSLRDQ